MGTQRSKLLQYLPRILIAAGALIFAAVFAYRFSITLLDSPAPTPINTQIPAPPPVNKAEIFLWVKVPTDTPPGDKIFIQILDEVTGLPYNTQTIEMVRADDTTFGIALHLRVGSILKYRYIRQDASPIPEYTTAGIPVRYRLFYADGPAEIHDIVSRWEDTVSTTQTGRIIGTAIEADTNLPISNLLIFAGGRSTRTAADGSFTITGLPPGQHQLVALAPDGLYKTYKQNALVAPLAATPVNLTLQPNAFVEVTFTVNVPENTAPVIPLRLAGSLYQLGSTFSDLGNGISSLPANMPQLVEVAPFQYALTIALPTNTHIQYKYTQGDGFWNAERQQNSGFVIRDLIIPTGQTTYAVTDTVSTWQSADTAPIWFDVTTPAYLPPSDQLYLQFNLDGWMSPLPMWQIAPNRWAFQLLNPTDLSNPLEYRYCRNAVCGAGAPTTASFSTDTLTTDTNFSETVTIVDTIENFYHLPDQNSPATVLSDPVQPRESDFIAGIAFYPHYSPAWETSTAQTFSQIQANHANTVILTPTWQITQNDPPLLQQVSGQTIPIPALGSQIQLAHQQGLQVALFPQIQAEISMDDWWLGIQTDGEWWQIWFEQYRTFILNYAAIAQRYDADILVLGGDWLYPVMPNGTMPNGTPSNSPADIEQRMTNLIHEVHAHFDGTVAWHYPHSWGLEETPSFLQHIDQIHLHWGISLATWSEAEFTEIRSRIELLLDNQVRPFRNSLNKPIIISAAYPSVSGGLTDCIQLPEDETCLPPEVLSPLLPPNPALDLDLQEQVEVYNALLAAINQRPWVSGFISEDYFPPLALQDLSPSIHGKPAEAVLRYWFGLFLGN